MGKESQGTADSPSRSVHAGSTGISRSRVLAGWRILWEGLPSEIIQALMCWELDKGNARNYSIGWSMAKASVGVGCFFVKQAGSVPFVVPACVSLGALQKAEVSTYIMSMSCLWSICLSEYFPRSQSMDSWQAAWSLLSSSAGFLPHVHLL